MRLAYVIICALLCFLLAVDAGAQSSPGYNPGQIVTSTQLNTAFATKQDYPFSGPSSGSVVVHSAVALATTAPLPANTYYNGVAGVGATLTANSNGVLSIDGVVVTAASRVLVINEVTAANNGVYVVTTVGNGSTPYVLTRATDFNSLLNITNTSSFMVTGGVSNTGSVYMLQVYGTIVIGTTPLVFAEFYSLNVLNAPLVLTGQISTPGSATGTLTNAPVSGNPQTWLQISINGVVHYIPAWHL